MGWVTRVTDDFNRANESPLTTNWTQGTHVNDPGSLNLISNQVVPSATNQDASAFYSGRAWTDDQSSSAILTCTGTTGGGSGPGLCVRYGAAATLTCYRFTVDHAASNNAAFFRFISGAFTSLVAWTQTFTDGDRFTLQVSGPASTARLEVLRNGASVQTFTDNSSLASGSPGMFYSETETAATWDDWQGGELVPSNVLAPIIYGRGAA